MSPPQGRLTPLNRDLVFLILKHLSDEKYHETVHRLEQESGLYFNVEYFNELIMAGKWEEAEKYLSGFTEIGDNRFSTKLIFELRKQKYLEALDSGDKWKAFEIVMKELQVFKSWNKEVYDEMVALLALENLREHSQLSAYSGTEKTRALLVREMKRQIKANPLLNDKTHFPEFHNSRMRVLLNHSLNWQHLQCRYPDENTFTGSLFYDHICHPANHVNGSHVVPRLGGDFQQLGPNARAAATLSSSISWAGYPFAPNLAVLGGLSRPNSPQNSVANQLRRPTSPAPSMHLIRHRISNREHPIERRALARIDEDGDNKGQVNVQVRTPNETEGSKLHSIRKIDLPSQWLSLGLPDDSMPANDGDNHRSVNVEGRNVNDMEGTKLPKVRVIKKPSQCLSLTLSDDSVPAKVSGLIYTKSGVAILAMVSGAAYKLWRWQKTDSNPFGKASTSVPPWQSQTSSEDILSNKTYDESQEETVQCFAISKNDGYVASASGSKSYLFSLPSFKLMTTFMHPPPAATCFAFLPQDNNFIVVGMDDSSIKIYNAQFDEVTTMLRGHQTRVTGLAFSTVLNVLVSSGADAQLCVWGVDTWEQQACRFLQIPSEHLTGPLSDTKVQFHQNQKQFLAVHGTQLGIFEPTKLKCIEQWKPQDGSITHATYSCDSHIIYVSFTDRSVGVFDEKLQMRSRINPAAYMPLQGGDVYPTATAAHTSYSNQFAVGLSNGAVIVMEPLESEGKWLEEEP